MPLPLIHYLYGSNISKYQRQSDQDGKDSSSWALVTGATDGIGKALCAELSARGFNVVLHGRNADKLTRVRNELQAAHPQCSYTQIAVDASSFTTQDIDRIAAAVAGLPLTVLVNNVGGTGVLTSNFKHFGATTPKEMEGLFSVNALFPIQLTAALLPQLESSGGGPSLVLNTGSQTSVGQPYLAAYSATKGAIHAWTRALAGELRAEGSRVDVTELLVGATYTQQFEGDAGMSPGLFMPTAETMARAMLDRVGHGHCSVSAYFWHKVQYWFVYSLLPSSIADSIVAGVLRPKVETKGY